MGGSARSLTSPCQNPAFHERLEPLALLVARAHHVRVDPEEGAGERAWAGALPRGTMSQGMLDLRCAQPRRPDRPGSLGARIRGSHTRLSLLGRPLWAGGDALPGCRHGPVADGDRIDEIAQLGGEQPEGQRGFDDHIGEVALGAVVPLHERRPVILERRRRDVR